MKILLILAHPDLEKSKCTNELIKHLKNVTIHDISKL